MKQKATFFKRALLSLIALLSISAGAKAQDMLSTPLTLEATSDGDITFSVTYSYTHEVVLTPVEYKVNDGSWTTYSSWPADAASITSSTDNWPVTFGDAIHVSAGDKVSFRGNNASYYGNGMGYNAYFSSTANVYVYGNVMSLIDASNFATLKTLTGSWNFGYLFSLPKERPFDPPITVTTIKSHPSNDIVLPATTLADNCYWGMFAGCKGITRAPELPATTMTASCYTEMFRATGLTAAPALPATVMQPYSYNPATGVETLGSIDCYMQMFQDCTELTVAPELPATTLTHGVYQNMFEGCTSLVNAPALPATDLTGADQCYTAMFKGCTSLLNAPALPAATLDQWCYMEMFSGCTSLVNAPALPATTLPTDCYHRMFEGCTSLKKAPVLPAPNITDQTYGGMFEGCTSLNYVKCLAVNIVDTSHGEDATTDGWLNNVSPTGTFVKADAADWSVKTKTGEHMNGIPAGWTVVNASEEVASMTETPLTFEAVEAGTITVNLDENWSPEKIQYKLNNGEWTDVTWGTPITLAANDLISFRGDNGSCYDDANWAGFHFVSSNDCYIYGNMMSLIDKEGFATNTTLTKSYTFFHLFQKSDYSANTTIKNHPMKDIVLPATTLTINCYDGLFADCKGITRAPKLPATALTDWCYCMMFSGTSITEAPALPATTLANACYSDMFMNCTSLTTAPELSAPTLVEGCYTSMFSGCTNLNYVKCLATDISADYCTVSWLDGVAASGTLVKPKMTDYPTGISGIPAGWTIEGAEGTADTETVTANSDEEATPAYWATFYRENVPCVADANTKVYTAKLSADKSEVELTEIDDKTIPAGNAVILKSTAANITMTYAEDATGTLANNDLQGSATEIETPTNTYMLTKGSNGVGFYHWTGANIPAGRGYLTLSGIAAARSYMSIGPGNGEKTAISTLEQATEEDSILYDLTGRPVEGQPRKGIYVKNGRKMIIK